MINRIDLHNITSVSIKREETQWDKSLVKYSNADKYIVMRFKFTDKDNSAFEVVAFSPQHETWTDAVKELTFNKLLPTTILIDKDVSEEERFMADEEEKQKAIAAEEDCPF